MTRGERRLNRLLETLEEAALITGVAHRAQGVGFNQDGIVITVLEQFPHNKTVA